MSVRRPEEAPQEPAESEPPADRRSGRSRCLEWAVAGRPRHGEELSGDRATVRTVGRSCVLAIVDGVGHGPEAAAAAELATDAIEQHPGEPLEALMLLTHERLSGSRGAAATVAIIDGDTGQLEWVGVGNVSGQLIRADVTARPRTVGVFLCRGVLGYNLPTLHVSQPVELYDGDHIVIATDGVRGDPGEFVAPEVPVAQAAEALLTRQAIDHDDALVFVGRYREPPE